jgi:hypothetical protein
VVGPDREFVVHAIGLHLSSGPGDRVGWAGFGDLMQGDLVRTVTDLLDGLLDRFGAMLGHRTESGNDAAVADPALTAWSRFGELSKMGTGLDWSRARYRSCAVGGMFG